MSARQRILDHLQDCEPHQVVYIARDTGTDLPTTKAWITELEREGLISVRDGKAVRISESQKWLRRAWR